MYNKLGPKKPAVLLGFHAITVADTCGKFATTTKERCFKLFMSFDDIILDALPTLGDEESIPGEHVINQLQRMVCVIYKQKKFLDVANLRWFLYANHQLQEENLPPTIGALLPHIYRAHYVSMIWKRALKCHQSLPSKTSYGWDVTEEKCMPVKKLNLPAPQGIRVCEMWV